MKVRKQKAKDARLVLLRMIADTQVCGPISARWNNELFASRAENLLAGWAVKHYRKYGRAPKHNIAGYYDRWASDERDEEVQDFIGRFLESLSKELKLKKHIASGVVLDTAEDVFLKVQARRLAEDINAASSPDDFKRIRKTMAAFRPVEVRTSSTYQPFAGGSIIRSAFRHVGESLIKWPNEAQDKFFGSMFAREEFIVFLGQDKVGKSFYLQEVAYQAWRTGLKVGFIETGDQSRDQLNRRLAARAAKRPFKKDDRVAYPTSMEITDEEKPEVGHKHSKYAEPMTGKEADAWMKKLGRKYGAENYNVAVYPNASINVHGIEALMDEWKFDGFVPDVLVVDYADILAPIEGKADTRDQINATWKAMRRMNQKLHCCLVTATQADADSYDSKMLSKSNFSEDKRKNAHLTGQLAINQTEPEKTDQLARLSWISGRDIEFSRQKQLWCAQCLAVANPMVLTKLS